MFSGKINNLNHVSYLFLSWEIKLANCSMSGWDNNQQWNNDQQWENDLPPSYDNSTNRAPPSTAPPPMYNNSYTPAPPVDNDYNANIGYKESTRRRTIFFAFIGIIVVTGIGLGVFLSPSCHDRPSSSGYDNAAIVVYKFRQPTFGDTFSICNDKKSYSGGKVVSITDQEDYDFIQNVRIQSHYLNKRWRTK